MAAGHDHPMLRELCPRGVLLEEGRVEADGDCGQVLERYFARESARAAAG